MAIEELSGAEMVIRTLADEGVKYIFGYPGGAVLHIYDALFQQSDVEHILVRHEQAAAHAADGYARVSGEPGIVLATSGPGATNTITGIATAYMDSIPMVVITGQVPLSLIGEDAYQETDMVGVSRPIVKHSFLVRHASDIPATIQKALYIATTGRPGPVVVDIPKDITNPNEKFPYQRLKKVSLRSYNPVVKGHTGQIKKALQALLQAKKPIIYAGGGVVQGNAAQELKELALALGVPVTNTLMGLGAFPGNHENFVGMLGMHGTYEANMAMHDSDFILAVGARFDDRVTNNVKRFCPNATIVHTDIDPASISKTVQSHIPIVGEANWVLKEFKRLYQASPQKLDAEALKQWWSRINGWRARNCLGYEQAETGTIKPQHVIKTLYDVTGGEAIITSDVGQHQMFAALYYKYHRPRQWINSGGLGTMGFGLPAAMGAVYADRNATVACVTGEGSIQMNIQELSTCAQYGLPVKIINLNNEYLGMVKQWQDMNYGGRYSSSTYQNSLPDFVKLVEAYGHVGIRVTRVEDLEAAMKECFAQKDRLVFMDIQIDRDEHVYPMQIKDGAMRDMWLTKTERS